MTNEQTNELLHGLRHWVFDLDDTLYPPSPAVYDQMAKRIQSYIMRMLDVDKETAWYIQKSYYKKYGATVHGLMIEHQIDPSDFTRYVHRLDLSSLKPDPEMQKLLAALPGKRYVFTNGAHEHAARVLEQIGLDKVIDGIFAIDEAGYVPKPAPQTYEKMLAAFEIDRAKSMMFDDNQANVLAAKKEGMFATWISSNVANNKYCAVDEKDFCDFQTTDVKTFLTPYFLSSGN